MSKLSITNKEQFAKVAEEKSKETISHTFSIGGVDYTVNYLLNCSVATAVKIQTFMSEHSVLLDIYGESFIALSVLKFATDIDMGENIEEASNFLGELAEIGALTEIFKAMPSEFLDQFNLHLSNMAKIKVSQLDNARKDNVVKMEKQVGEQTKPTTKSPESPKPIKRITERS
jgi:hypothetical protein